MENLKEIEQITQWVVSKSNPRYNDYNDFSYLNESLEDVFASLGIEWL
jgi:hypothetical protein